MTDVPDDAMERARELRQRILWASNGSIEVIARMLLAERAQERERCARVADDVDGVFTDYGEDRNNAVAQRTSRRIAAAIRGGPNG